MFGNAVRSSAKELKCYGIDLEENLTAAETGEAQIAHFGWTILSLVPRHFLKLVQCHPGRRKTHNEPDGSKNFKYEMCSPGAVLACTVNWATGLSAGVFGISYARAAHGNRRLRLRK